MNLLRLVNGTGVAVIAGILCLGCGILISDAYIRIILPATSSGPDIWQPAIMSIAIILLGWTVWFTYRISRGTVSRSAGWLTATILYLVITTSIGALYIQPASYQQLPTGAILALLILLAALYYSSVSYLQYIHNLVGDQ